jgi:hypothetical protein
MQHPAVERVEPGQRLSDISGTNCAWTMALADTRCAARP